VGYLYRKKIGPRSLLFEKTPCGAYTPSGRFVILMDVVNPARYGLGEAETNFMSWEM
jgi:hypothetical protein